MLDISEIDALLQIFDSESSVALNDTRYDTLYNAKYLLTLIKLLTRDELFWFKLQYKKSSNRTREYMDRIPPKKIVYSLNKHDTLIASLRLKMMLLDRFNCKFETI